MTGRLACAAAMPMSAFAAPGAQAANITGAGATFPYPIYAKWANAYHAENGAALKFFGWAYRNGRKMADEHNYVPVPDSVAKLMRAERKTRLEGGAGKPLQ